MRGRAALLVVLAALASGCREPDSFQPPELRPALGGGHWRLTYSTDDDRAPAWSPAGDSIYYVNAGLRSRFTPRGIGILVGVPIFGGAAGALVPEQVQALQTRWFSAPTVASDGKLAFVEVARVNPTPLCEGRLACTFGDTVAPIPPLANLSLRIRDPRAAIPLPIDPALSMAVEGRALVDDGPPLRFDVRWHPFQTVFESERAPVFRPSWDPDGSRVVMSDGLRLLLWSPGGAGGTPIPGTQDGVLVAWSPGGEWIAFEQLERADSSVQTCDYNTGFGTACESHRVVYSIGRRTIRLIRPDGTDLRVLTEGEEPAWSPDGTALYVSRDDGIWRVPVSGDGPEERIPHTEGGQQPAVSPDGSLLAFIRETSPDNHNRDVWIVRLP